MDAPVRVSFSEHAAERASKYDLPYTDVADAVLEQHGKRRRNPGSADWLVISRRLVVAYNWPHKGDQMTAHVVTLWIEE
jgi:hypothetical protein